jgi:hypothetical protein
LFPPGAFLQLQNDIVIKKNIVTFRPWKEHLSALIGEIGEKLVTCGLLLFLLKDLIYIYKAAFLRILYRFFAKVTFLGSPDSKTITISV